MRPARLLLAVCALGAIGAVLPSYAAASDAPYVVLLNDGAAGDVDARIVAATKAAGVAPGLRYRSALQGFSARLTSAQVTKLRSLSGVRAVVADTTYEAAGTQSVLSGESVPPGTRRIGASGPGAVHEPANHAVAVLDSGIDLAHPDLNASEGTNCIKPGTTSADDNGHGTNVAGIIGARNNGVRVTGVAPGTRVISVKVLNAKNAGTLSQILCGIDWVTANAAARDIRVANMSIVGAGTDDGNCGRSNNDLYHQAICRSTAAGVAYVAAAGNLKADLAKTAPAAYSETLPVTAMSDANGAPGGGSTFSVCKTAEKDDQYGTYSNYSASAANRARVVAAPGTCVVSDGRGGGTSTYTGTSQASPHVAGVLSLCFGSGGVAGPCEGLAPAGAIARVRSDAATRMTAANGFLGDPLRPISSTKAYGPIVSAGGY
jgi:subtilisin